MSEIMLKTLPRHVLRPYGIAILAIELGLALKLALASELHGEASYLFFLPAILIASALGGWGPGLVATALGLALGLYFVTDVRAATASDILNAVTFAVFGIGVSWRGKLLVGFRLSAAASAEEAHARAAHLQSILDSIPEAMVVIDERTAYNHSAPRRSGCLAVALPKITLPAVGKEEIDDAV